MTEIKYSLERIADLADSIFIVATNANSTETECIKTLAQLISEEIEKLESEKSKNES